MKQTSTILAAILLCLVFISTGVMMGRTILNPIKPCTKMHFDTEDNRFVVTPADTVDGRPTYNISFPDSSGLDSMYPEEIANSLLTGKWGYNEDLVIKERD